MELRSSLVVESPIPPDATIWDQSLVYVVRSCWERAAPSPVHQQVSHTWLFPAQREDREPETWVTAGRRWEETRRGTNFSAAGLRGLHLLLQKRPAGLAALPPVPAGWQNAAPWGRARQAAPLQVRCVPRGDTGTPPAPGHARPAAARSLPARQSSAGAHRGKTRKLSVQ